MSHKASKKTPTKINNTNIVGKITAQMPNQEYQANVKKILKIKKTTNNAKLNLWYLFLKMV